MLPCALRLEAAGLVQGRRTRSGGPSCALLDFSRMVLACTHAGSSWPAHVRSTRLEQSFLAVHGSVGCLGCMPRLFAAEVSMSVSID